MGCWSAEEEEEREEEVAVADAAAVAAERAASRSARSLSFLTFARRFWNCVAAMPSARAPTESEKRELGTHPNLHLPRRHLQHLAQLLPERQIRLGVDLEVVFEDFKLLRRGAPTVLDFERVVERLGKVGFWAGTWGGGGGEGGGDGRFGRTGLRGGSGCRVARRGRRRVRRRRSVLSKHERRSTRLTEPERLLVRLVLLE